MTIVRPPYALEREDPPSIGSGSISLLAMDEAQAKAVTKHPIGFVPPEPAQTKRKARKPKPRVATSDTKR